MLPTRFDALSMDLERALEDLSYEQRQVLHLVFIEGHSHRSAGHTIGISRQAVTERIRRVRAKFLKQRGRFSA